MAILKIRHPVEYSFLQWMNNFPHSGHWADRERFFVFVKTVCKYNSTKWKRPEHLKARILKARPHFDPDILDRLLYLYGDLIEFHTTHACPNIQIAHRRVKKGNHIELRVKDGNIYELEVPS